MKISFNPLKKEVSAEADVERLVEKKMELDEKDWKDKLLTKTEVKKDLMKLKHEQKLEMEEQKSKKKGFFEKIREDRERRKELELEQQRKLEEERKKLVRMKIIAGVILSIVALLFIIVGGFKGSASEDDNSPWYMIAVLGIFPAAGAILLFQSASEKKK